MGLNIYSNLEESLKLNGGKKIATITTNVSEEIGKVFLAKNAPRATKPEAQNQKLNEFASEINDGSESMKVKFALTINHLAKDGLLNPASIKSLKIRGKDSNEKLQNIIDDLVNNRKTPLTDNQKTQLDQAVATGIEKHYIDLANKDNMSEEIKARNEELEEELNASEAANEVVESAVLKSRSRKNSIRVGKAIERINKNKKGLDPATKARKVLWQANSFAVFGSGKRFDWVNKLPRKFDIGTEYNNVVSKLSTKMDNAKEAREKVAIRYIMRQVNKAYTEYMDAISIDEETRRNNMKTINQKMAA